MRRNNGRCNGTLFWQLNDCWPVNSWSSIDYKGKWKALNYYAKRFFEPVTFSFLKDETELRIYGTSEREKDFKGLLKWRIIDFDGKIKDLGQKTVELKFNEVKELFSFNIEDYLKYKNKSNTVFLASLYDESGKEISYNTYDFTKERNMKLKKANIEKQVNLVNDELKITLKSDTFVKSLMLHMEGINEPFSDNFFDLIPNEAKTVTVKIKDEKIKMNIENLLSVRSLNNAEPKYSRLKELIIKSKIGLKPMNIINRLIYKFFV
jgi:beta-mannosidase